MKVYLDKTQKTTSIQYEGTVQELLEKLQINPETIIIEKEGSLLTDKDKLKNTDSIRILSVVSGG